MNNDHSSELRIRLGSLLMRMTQPHPQVTLHKCFQRGLCHFSAITDHQNITEQEASTSRKLQYPKAAAHLFLTRDQQSKSCLDHYSKSNLYYLHRLSVESQTEFKILSFVLMSYILWLRIHQHTPCNTVSTDNPKLVQSVLAHRVHRAHMCTRQLKLHKKIKPYQQLSEPNYCCCFHFQNSVLKHTSQFF